MGNMARQAADTAMTAITVMAVLSFAALPILAAVALALFLCAGCATPKKVPVFNSAWPEGIERDWAGPEYWANRLQDWRLAKGRLECLIAKQSKPMRTVHLLTRNVGELPGDLSISVRTGLVLKRPGPRPAVIRTLPAPADISLDAATGFLVGAGAALDYRAAALVHSSPGPGGGIFAGIDGSGHLFIRDFSLVPGGKEDDSSLLVRGKEGGHALEDVRLLLLARPCGNNNADRNSSELTLACINPHTDRLVGSVRLPRIDSSRLKGSVALVSHPGSAPKTARFWFDDWKITGSRVEAHRERRCGPIVSSQYTLSRGILKLTAQLMPIGAEDGREVTLSFRKDGRWITAGKAPVVTPGFTATFRIAGWDDECDIPFRLTCNLKGTAGMVHEYSNTGTIRHDPKEKGTIVVAAFTGNHNVAHPGVERGRFDWLPEGVWFPHNDIVSAVRTHRPDLLFFSGDQVYEGASPTGRDRSSPRNAELDYLYKWYLWCWAFGELTAEIPCVTIPDDHDVFHGNLWGAGGRSAKKQDDGGYTMPPEFVRMVERTQTSHLPDPADPAPVEQGIGVYFCAMDLGGIGFAVLEDRKFKTSPTVAVPLGRVVNGWFKNRDFDPLNADVPGAVLLGERQLAFLHDWAVDWRHGVEMKAALSQTIFSNVATLPASAKSDAVVPRLPILPEGAYAVDDRRAHDADSNGWPQTGRNRALRELQRGFAVHIAGDQHLGSTIQYGVDGWRDAGFALCVPSIANFFPRRWFPSEGGRNRDAGAPEYTGDFLDGFGNHMTVHAVSNPAATGREPKKLHQRAPGYGVVRFDKVDRTITFECWPRWADQAVPGAAQYPGWPITISQLDNFGSDANLFLPVVDVAGMSDPVVEVIDEEVAKTIYALRIRGDSFRPKVFREGSYTVRVGDPDRDLFVAIPGIRPAGEGDTGKFEVTF
jgi:alkaline phosphatase D